MVMRKMLKAGLRGLKHWLDEGEQSPTREIPFDNSYDWLRESYKKLEKDPLCAKRVAYIWGVLQGAALGKVLGFERISMIEFGVAGGRGLLAMERIAERVEEMAGIGIDVYGFDAETGLPKPQDYRDLPNIFLDGQYPMDKKELEKRLRRARLKLGLVKETVPAFLESTPAPVAFVSFDLDLYSSTMHAFKLFEAKESLLLPRVLCYFDDIMGFTYSDFNGERLAISEFNATHSMRKLSPLYGLKIFVPSSFKNRPQTEYFYFLHIHDHPLYNHPDSLRTKMRITIDGETTDSKPTIQCQVVK
jgi:hypothetical protein